MAKIGKSSKNKTDYKPEDIMFPDQNITSSELVNEMKTSYIEYAMSVIVGRALPDVRDGLKPVHRRILYAMYEDGLTRDKPYRKCATAVGDVLGRYHPHGDASVYDALVRLAQDFSMRYPLIDGHGNFGSVDGDPPAAYRYTEARMSKMCDEMLRDIDKDTVDWDPNFDETRKEPRVLPSRFPNLLVNGSSGIAVGMATNIPPHNLREVIDAAIYVIDNPDAATNDLMDIVKGPDFPTKGIIMGKRGIREAYETGKGHITVRAKAEFEEYNNGRTRIIVSELPYQVNKRMLIKNMADLVHEKKLDGITDIRDETDRTGMRIVIELRKDVNPQVVLNKLFSQTQLQITFGVNMIALVDNQTQPRMLSLKKILEEYISYQKEIILRRTKYDLKKALERVHLIEGLFIAQQNIEEVIRIIRASYDDAKENLMNRFGLSDIQASAILEMRLRQLQGLEEEKLRAEYDEWQKKIEFYNKLINSEEMLVSQLKIELTDIRDRYGDDRLTEIADVEDDLLIEDLIEEKTCVFTLTHCGYIKRLSEDNYKVQGRGGRGVTALTTKEEDYVENIFVSSTHQNILFFTSKGKVYVLKGYQIPEGGRQAKGMNVVNLLELDDDEKITAMIPLNGFEENKFFSFITRKGVIKRVRSESMRNIRRKGLRAISLDENDELVSVLLTEGKEQIMIFSSAGMAVRFNESDIRVMGRSARGVRGIRLGEDDIVVSALVYDEERKILTVTENGFGKRTDMDLFRLTRRGSKGIRCHKIVDKTGKLVSARSVSEEEDLLVISSLGIIIRVKISAISVIGRASAGVHVMRMTDDASIINIAVLESGNSDDIPEETPDSVQEIPEDTLPDDENDGDADDEVDDEPDDSEMEEEPEDDEDSDGSD